MLTPGADIKVNTFCIIIDRLEVDLLRRCLQRDRRSFSLHQSEIFSDHEIKEIANDLIEVYNHLEKQLAEERVYLKAYLFVIKLKEFSMSRILQIIVEKCFMVVYPNRNIALRIYLCTLSINASEERSFSVIKRVKNY